MGIDSENALEKFDDLVKGYDYDGVHTMIANLQTPAARGAKERRAFRMWLSPAQRFRPAWIAP
jgi:hypothetical protein